LATLTSADENCSQATTTVKPRSAPYTKATVVKNGDNVELCSGPTELGIMRFVIRMAPIASIADARMTSANSSHTFTAPTPRSV
jgi:hypothetical protein